LRTLFLRLLDMPAPQALECFQFSLATKTGHDNHAHFAFWAVKAIKITLVSLKRHVAAPMDQA
jgi:hypothetical protein